MKKVKIHPLIILSLIISSITMALYAHRSYINQETGYGMVFTLLVVLMVGMAIHSLIRNRKINNEENE